RPLRLHRPEEDCVRTPRDLPHSYPFRFVETVLEPRDEAFTRGKVLVSVSANGRAASGAQWHSPFLLAEAIAQSALLLEGGDRPDRLPRRCGELRGRPAAPGRGDAGGPGPTGRPVRGDRQVRRRGLLRRGGAGAGQRARPAGLRRAGALARVPTDGGRAREN